MDKKRWQSLIFVVVCVGILAFFLMAPESTTPRMPRDGDHGGRRKDPTPCLSCHPPGVLPEDHTLEDGSVPTGKFKCYFCHKLEDAS
ncbi:MAG: hypothetical protein JSV26_07700 [bacterium]|nr:MAG: hypothetical protein JSV26_07700 [bacterium]